MSLTTYVAGAFERKEEIAEYAEILREEHGWDITSTWLKDSVLHTQEYLKAHPEEGVAFAQRDLHDIMQSRQVLLFTGEMGRGGHQVEMGFALGLGLRVVVIGPVVNLFCLLTNAQYPTWEDFLYEELGVEVEEKEDVYE